MASDVAIDHRRRLLRVGWSADALCHQPPGGLLMRSGGGALKGAEFERRCCKRLSLRFTQGKRDDTMWRTAMSGGRATFQLRQDIINRAQAGDLTAISAEAFELCERHLFEVKSYKNLNFTALITSGAGLLAGFWRKTQTTAARLDKHPVLIAKQNRYPTVVLCPIDCGLFPANSRWAIFPALGAELHWFEPATEVIRPRIKRPNTPSIANVPQWSGLDSAPPVRRRRKVAAE